MDTHEPLIDICADYISLSEKASTHIAALVKQKPDAILCLPTGSTPTLTYQLLAKKFESHEFPTDRLTIVKLDEWGGLSSDHPGSCEAYLQTNVIEPLKIPKSQYIAFQCNPKDPENEARSVGEVLAMLPPFDLVMLGLGVNGHVGFNEPGELTGKVHVAKLDESSLKHPMLQNSRDVKYGMTIGFDDILRAREILMLVAGEFKSEQLRRMLKDEVSANFPATNLRKSENLRVIADKSAAALL